LGLAQIFIKTLVGLLTHLIQKEEKYSTLKLGFQCALHLARKVSQHVAAAATSSLLLLCFFSTSSPCRPAIFAIAVPHPQPVIKKAAAMAAIRNPHRHRVCMAAG